LELLKRICAAFFESKLAITDQTSRTMPIILGLMSYRGIEAVRVISVIARLAVEQRGKIV
jgi:hypothetical protein